MSKHTCRIIVGGDECGRPATGRCMYRHYWPGSHRRQVMHLCAKHTYLHDEYNPRGTICVDCREKHDGPGVKLPNVTAALNAANEYTEQELGR